MSYLKPFEKLLTRLANDFDAERRRTRAIRHYDEIEVGRQRERQLIAEAERIAACRKSQTLNPS